MPRNSFVLQAFYDELEKIAAGWQNYAADIAKRPLQDLAHVVQQANWARQATRTNTGLRRFIPFTQEWGASAQANRELRGVRRGVRSELSSRRADLMAKLRKPDLTAAEQQDIHRNLAALNEFKPQMSRVPKAPTDLKPLPEGGHPVVEGTSTPNSAPASTPTQRALRAAAIYGGVGVAGAGALYAGQQYLKYRQAQEQDPSTYYV